MRITLPDGTIATGEQADLERIVSSVLGREVAFARTAPEAPSLEEYWPDIEGLALRETITRPRQPMATRASASPSSLTTDADVLRPQRTGPSLC